MAWDEHGRRGVVVATVVALHLSFLLALLTRDGDRLIRREAMHRDFELFFIEDSAPDTPEPPQPTTREPTIQSAAPKAVVITSAEPTGITAPTEAPAIDWRAQATQSATEVIDKAIRQETRECDLSDRPNSFLPPCTRKEHKFEWNPEEPRVGFSRGLPYVRLGDRCVIGLGFFGCGIGKKPPPNGELFEHMDDPERDRSSVPALADPPSQRQHVPSLPAPDSGH